jgi:hypothetical protein
MSDIMVSILKNDCFGIINKKPDVFGLEALPKRAFQFASTDAKINGFMDWLKAQEETGILQIIKKRTVGGDVINTPWPDVYIKSAYQRGLRNADKWLKNAGLPGSVTYQLPGGRRNALVQPIHASRVGLIYSRTYEDLRSVTDVMNAQVRRKITEGLTTGLAKSVAEGKNPRMIARELVKDVNNRVDKIGIVRSRMIARTEVLNAHNEAILLEYQQAEKIMGVPVMVDVSLGANPCEVCVDLEAGGPYNLTQAMGQLPAHPNCVCVHMPNVEGKKDKQYLKTPITVGGKEFASVTKAFQDLNLPMKEMVKIRAKLKAERKLVYKGHTFRMGGQQVVKKKVTPQPIRRTPTSKGAYTPKETWAEAVAWTKQNKLAKRVDYKKVKGVSNAEWGDPLFAEDRALKWLNDVNAELDRIQRKFKIKLPQLDQLLLRNMDTAYNGIGQAQVSARTVGCHVGGTNVKHLKNYLKKRKRAWHVADDVTLANDLKGYGEIVRHEWGHIIDGKYNLTWRAAIFEEGKWYNLVSKLKTDYKFTAVNVSDYAKTNTKEFFAEIFSYYVSPDYGKTKKKLPALLEKFMKDVMKRMKRK